MITREEIEIAIENLGFSKQDAEDIVEAIGRRAALVPRKATHEMLIASIKDDQHPIDAAIEEGDLTK